MSTSLPPTAAELDVVVQTLAKLEPSFLPIDLFHQIARLSVLSIIEFVPLRRRAERIEVLLLPRPTNDTFWRGKLHTPGTILRSTDTPHSYADAYNRLLDEELAGTKVAGEPRYVQAWLERGPRGTANALVYYVEIAGEPKVGAFYDVDKLPSNMVSEQIGFIQAAVERFRADTQASKTKHARKAPDVPGAS